jgi:hypothetical protein
MDDPAKHFGIPPEMRFRHQIFFVHGIGISNRSAKCKKKQKKSSTREILAEDQLMYCKDKNKNKYLLLIWST